MRVLAAGERCAVIGLGSNIGHRFGFLAGGLARLARTQDVAVEAVSPVYASKAVGPVAQGTFLNAAVRLRTRLTPLALLERCLAIEAELGRVRYQDQGPRVIDLDVLYVQSIALSSARLRLPHPQLLRRPFAWLPFVEVWDLALQDALFARLVPALEARAPDGIRWRYGAPEAESTCATLGLKRLPRPLLSSAPARLVASD